MGKKVDLSPDFIIKMISELSGLSVDDITGHERHRPKCAARNISISIIHKNIPGNGKDGKITVANIGKIFGKRDHTSILKSLQVLKDMIYIKEPSYMELLGKVENKMASYNN